MLLLFGQFSKRCSFVLSSFVFSFFLWPRNAGLVPHMEDGVFRVSGSICNIKAVSWTWVFPSLACCWAGKWQKDHSKSDEPLDLPGQLDIEGWGHLQPLSTDKS